MFDHQTERLPGEKGRYVASKQKGMWMGGMPPLGYAVREHKLVILPGEADTVRHIFRRYRVLGSVRLLRDELQLQGVVSKRWTSGSGRSWGGKPIARGALYLMLQNRIYCGDIVHKDKHYPGEHQAIIEPELWEAVQARLGANAVERSTGERAKNPSLLAGLLFDADGNRMTPTHAVKKGRRYRYYVSHPLITQARAGSPDGLRVPAPEIEQLVAKRLCQFLSEPDSILEIAQQQALAPAMQQRLIERAAEIAGSWSSLPPMQMPALLAILIRHIEVRPDRVELQLRPARLPTILGIASATTGTAEDADLLILSVAAQLRR